MKLTDDIRAREANHQVLLERRAEADRQIAESARTIEALKAALTEEEKLELNPPAPEPAAATEAPEIRES